MTVASTTQSLHRGYSHSLVQDWTVLSLAVLGKSVTDITGTAASVSVASDWAF